MSHLASEDFSEITSEDQYPESLNICSSKQWKHNWKCVVLTCMIVTCIASVALCYPIPNQMIKNTQEAIELRNMRWILILCAVVLYSLYLMECSYATDKIQLCSRNTESVETVKTRIERMKNSEPLIWWKATCYHFARRKRRTTQFRRGTYLVSTKIYQERFNSFTTRSTFNYACCGVKDISNNLIIRNSDGPIVKFSFSKGFAFANMASAVEFEEQRSTFFRDLRSYDDYMEIHEGLDLTDFISFEEEVVALNSCKKRPWFSSPFYYWLFSCCLLSWPYRLILLHNTVHVNYKITKLFGTNYNNFSESAQQLALLHLYGSYSTDGNLDTPWSEDATINSMTDVRPMDCVLAPTYSEAMLLDDRESLIAESQSSRSAEVLNKSGPSLAQRRRRYSSLGRLHSSFTESADDDSSQPFLDDVEEDENQPPPYEEAFSFPIVENAVRPPTPGHDLRPSRFLSIETSL